LTPESRLYTLIDDSREFALYFLEGQRLIQDMALLHPIRRTGFAYFRDVVLSVQPMIAFLKHGEQFGFYIDSAEPYFRLKIETAHHGTTRCMLLPENFQEFPEAMRGLVRVHKLFPDSPPYESVLKVEGLPLREIVNRVLDDSYQVNCAMMLSEVSDQSVLLHQLPPMPGKDEYEFSPQAVRSRREEIRSSVREIFARALHRRQQIDEAFAEIGFRLLAHRPMRFRCSCSRTRMIENLQPVYQQEGESLFDAGADDLEVVCEYCKSRYRVSRKELSSRANRAH
jgi:molecular chaperone Hsp33